MRRSRAFGWRIKKKKKKKKKNRLRRKIKQQKYKRIDTYKNIIQKLFYATIINNIHKKLFYT